MEDFLLCQVADVGDGELLECEGPDGEAIAVARVGGDFYAVQGECPHQGAPLAEGDLENGELTCALHFWKWRVKDGAPLEEAEEALATYPIIVRDGGVYLRRGE